MSDAGSGSRLRSSRPEHDRDRHAGERAAAGQALRGEDRLADAIGEPEARQHHDERGENAGQLLAHRCRQAAAQRPTSQKPPMTSAAAEDAYKQTAIAAVMVAEPNARRADPCRRQRPSSRDRADAEAGEIQNESVAR